MLLVTNNNLNNLFKSSFLSVDQRTLIEDGVFLVQRMKEKSLNHISDYSFLVAPFAKAYEGFLKDFFLKLGLITSSDYYSNRFRVGKVLNPNLRKKKFSVYSRLENLGKEGEELAKRLWRAWKRGRNLIFHYFPRNLNKLTFGEAEERIHQIIRAINAANSLLDKKRVAKDN